MEAIVVRGIQLVLSLSILVIIHELGHFLFSKAFNVRVEKFYLFFNPWFSLYKFKPKGSETEYGLGWLPLGGYVKISGMIDESMDKEQMAQPEQAWEFRSKPAWQRLLIMVGGVMMNFILAFFIYSMVLFTWGEEYLPVSNITMGLSYNEITQKAGFQNGDLPLTVDGVHLDKLNGQSFFAIAEAKEVIVLRKGQKVTINLPADFNKVLFEKTANFTVRHPFVIVSTMNSAPAKQAGLLDGDSIVGVGDKTDMSAGELISSFEQNKSKTLALNVYRNNQLMQVSITPNEDGKIGVTSKSPFQIYETLKTKYSFFGSFPAGIRMGIDIIKSYLNQFKYIFSKKGAESLGGFGTIASFFPGTWNWFSFWNMTAFLSIILGVMNLLPIPALDGGHVMFLLYEVVSGRKPNEKFMEYAQMAGMIFLIGLLLYANGNDVIRHFFSK